MRPFSPAKPATNTRLIHAAMLALLALRLASPLSAAPEYPSIDDFQDSYSHWHNFGGMGNIISPVPGQRKDRHKPEQYRAIAENILLFQNENGGWPKDYDMCAKLTDAQKKDVAAARATSTTSFDNHNIHSQVSFLAKTYTLTNDTRHADACLRGLKFILASQLKSGGWPQMWPTRQKNRNDYHGHITYNDGVTLGCLRVLRDAALGQNGFKWLDTPSRKIAQQAVNRGITCILNTQYVNKKGVLTAWGQQHYADTLKPAPARNFELACLTPQDSTTIVQFLMLIENPPEALMRSIVAACEWMKKVRLAGPTGLRFEQFQSDTKIEGEKDKRDAYRDARTVPDPKAKPTWAREYDMEKDIPIYAGKDSVPKYDFNQIDRYSRVRTPWFGNYAGDLLKTDYPDWLKRNPAAQKFVEEYRAK